MTYDAEASSELHYEDVLPIVWQGLAGPLSSHELWHVNQRALSLLQTVLAWGELGPPESADESQARAPELLRLESKLNLLLELVGEVLSRQEPVRPAVPVRLGSETVTWETAQTPAPSGQGLLTAYLLSGLPKGLTLPAVVEDVVPVDGGFRVMARLEGLAVPVQDYLEKLIFRHHRRRVAEARRGRAL